MRKTLYLVFVLVLLISLMCLVSCSVSADMLTVCEEDQAHFYEHPEGFRDRYYYGIGAIIESLPVYAVEFDDGEEFYRAIKNKDLSQKSFDTLLRYDFQKDRHEQKLGIPQLDEIVTLSQNGETVSQKVVWYGCSNYYAPITLVLGEESFTCRFAHYTCRNPIDQISSAYSQSTETENGIDYSNYIYVDKDTVSENDYIHTARIFRFTEGACSYTAVETTLTEKTPDGTETLFYRFYDIEILYGGEYYYLYIGDEYEIVPTLTPEIVKSFTLKSFN